MPNTCVHRSLKRLSVDNFLFSIDSNFFQDLLNLQLDCSDKKNFWTQFETNKYSTFDIEALVDKADMNLSRCRTFN